MSLLLTGNRHIFILRIERKKQGTQSPTVDCFDRMLFKCDLFPFIHCPFLLISSATENVINVDVIVI